MLIESELALAFPGECCFLSIPFGGALFKKDFVGVGVSNGMG